MSFLDPGKDFSGFLNTSLLRHLVYHALETLLLDDVPDGIASALETLSALVFVDDVTDGVT